MLKDVLKRVEERLVETGQTAAEASRKAGLSRDAIRNMRRAVENDSRQGVSTATIAALAPVLKTTQAWLLDGTTHEEDELLMMFRRLEQLDPVEVEHVRTSVYRLLDGALRDAATGATKPTKT